LPGSIYLPEEVKASIAAHVIAAVAKAEALYNSAAQEEDSLTGQLGMALSSPVQSVTAVSNDRRGEWKWSISYTKFRGRGKGAPENIIGADGIFELRVTHGGGIETKSLLFQAKNDWSDDANLAAQSVKLSNWREAAAVVNFRPEVIEVFRLDEIIASRGSRAKALVGQSFSAFFVEEYLECHVGDTQLRYDAPRHRLIWRSQSGELVAAKFRLRSRLRVDVVAPDSGYSEPIALQDADIFNHRMAASAREILGLDYHTSEAAAKKVVAKIRKALHSDTHGHLDAYLRGLLDQRMQEVNAAYDSFRHHSSPRKPTGSKDGGGGATGGRHPKGSD
jgi:hypothetical protein